MCLEVTATSCLKQSTKTRSTLNPQTNQLAYRTAMKSPRNINPERRWHDMGGEQSDVIPMEGHDFSIWEKRVDALLVLCNVQGLFTVDGLRRVLEDMGPDAFETLSYYERWIMSINQNLIENGVYSVEELGARMQQVKDRGATYGEASGA